MVDLQEVLAVGVMMAVLLTYGTIYLLDSVAKAYDKGLTEKWLQQGERGSAGHHSEERLWFSTFIADPHHMVAHCKAKLLEVEKRLERTT